MMLFALAILMRGFYLKSDTHGRTRWFSKYELLLVIPALIVFALRTELLHHVFDPAQPITYGYPAAARIKTVIVVLGTLLQLSLFPALQTLHYGHLRFAIFGHPWLQLAWIAASAILAVIAAKDIGWRPVLFGASWFIVALFPVLNVIPALVLVAERNLYLPVAGLIFVFATWAAGKRPWTSAQRIAAMAVLALCVLAGNRAVLQWRNEETVWRSAIRAHPDSPMAHLLLADQLVRIPGSETEAVREYRKALELNPGLADARRALAALGQ